MARINLLPWREALRKRKQQEFFILIGFAAAVTVGLLFVARLFIADMIVFQQQRNTRIQQEIAAVDRKIKEINNLEKTKKELLARMEIIQQLQRSRPQIVHLFDEVVRTLPDGVHLTTFSQSGNNLSIQGLAESNARVSSYMRNIEGSPWLDKPTLIVIDSKGRGLKRFQLKATQRDKPKEGENAEEGTET